MVGVSSPEKPDRRDDDTIAVPTKEIFQNSWLPVSSAIEHSTIAISRQISAASK